MTGCNDEWKYGLICGATHALDGIHIICVHCGICDTSVWKYIFMYNDDCALHSNVPSLNNNKRLSLHVFQCVMMLNTTFTQPVEG
jgi:hypothetical protein